MFDSIEDNFFLEKATRDLEKVDDPVELRKFAIEALSLYLQHKQVTKKLFLSGDAKII